MDLRISSFQESLDVEVVERKGIGHPDSLADILAESFSNDYSLYCLENFGTVLNYWFDKVTLSGGVCSLDFGKCDVLKPVTVYLFGRITTSFGEHQIPYENLFKKTCFGVFKKIFGDNFKEEFLVFHFDVNSARGADHDKTYYAPSDIGALKTAENYTANDTVVCHGYAPLSNTEKLTVEIENFLNSKEFKMEHPYTGQDIKVLVIRKDNSYRITICVPFIAVKTPSYQFYSEKKSLVLDELREFIIKSKSIEGRDFDLLINTKDVGSFAYLVSFGSAVDKGDYGAVGRGNRYSGVISVNRGTNVEAVSGKNSRNHSGKLYTVLSYSLASFIFKLTNKSCQVIISTDNGRDLSDPTAFFVIFDDKNFTLDIKDEKEVKEKVSFILSNIGLLSSSILKRDPVEDFKNYFIYD